MTALLPTLLCLVSLSATPPPEPAALASGPSLLQLSARAGAAFPRLPTVDIGPSLGAALRLRLSRRYAVLVEGDTSLHGIPRQPGAGIETLTGSLGFEVAFDHLPVVPTASLGPAYQYARRTDRAATATSFGAMLGFGVRANPWKWLQLGAQIRYSGAGFSNVGFPAFTSASLEVGWEPAQ